MLSKKLKRLLDKEAALYLAEKKVIIDRDIQSRKDVNWNQVSDARVENMEKQVEIKVETVLLEAKRPHFEEIIESKNREIEWLRNLVFESVKKSAERIVWKL